MYKKVVKFSFKRQKFLWVLVFSFTYLVVVDAMDRTIIFQLTVNGLRGQLAVQVPAVQHVEQARNLELFKSKHNMGVKYVLEYHRGAVTPCPVQVSTFIIEEKWRRTQNHEFLKICIFPDIFSRFHKRKKEKENAYLLKYK